MVDCLMSTTSDKVDAPAERDDTEGDGEREKQEPQEMSTHSSTSRPPTTEAEGTADQKSDVVDPLENDIEKVSYFFVSLRQRSAGNLQPLFCWAFW